MTIIMIMMMIVMMNIDPATRAVELVGEEFPEFPYKAESNKQTNKQDKYTYTYTYETRTIINTNLTHKHQTNSKNHPSSSRTRRRSGAPQWQPRTGASTGSRTTSRIIV